MKTMGGRVQQARLDAGLTQHQLAEKVGCKKLSIIHLEADRTNPRFGTLVSVCAVLGISIDKTVYGK
jgi:DNA-binding XRE family transcriptional regulator